MKIEWPGGPCPVADNCKVRVWFRNGTVIFGYTAEHFDWGRAADGDSVDEEFEIVTYEVAR